MALAPRETEHPPAAFPPRRSGWVGYRQKATRLLSSVARAPGEGRSNVVNYVENRQAGQGRRVSNALSEGFEAPETAAQIGRRLTQARDEAANEEFGAVREDARPVD